MKYFDVHTHTNARDLVNEFETIAQEVIEKKMGMNIVGTTLKDSYIAIEQAKKHKNFYCSIGIHPNEIDSHNIKTDIKELEQLYLDNQDKVKCIGECGLDYHYGGYNKLWQEKFLIEQVKLALKYGLTLMIHVRDAYQELVNILDEFDLSSINVIIHCFTSNSKDLALFIDRNFFVSISGVVTYKNANELREAILDINLKYLLTETDAPYLAPSPHRGETNYPYLLKFTNSYLAWLLGVDSLKLNEALVDNAIRALKLPPIEKEIEQEESLLVENININEQASETNTHQVIDDKALLQENTSEELLEEKTLDKLEVDNPTNTEQIKEEIDTSNTLKERIKFDDISLLEDLVHKEFLEESNTESSIQNESKE